MMTKKEQTNQLEPAKGSHSNVKFSAASDDPFPYLSADFFCCRTGGKQHISAMPT